MLSLFIPREWKLLGYRIHVIVAYTPRMKIAGVQDSICRHLYPKNENCRGTGFSLSLSIPQKWKLPIWEELLICKIHKVGIRNRAVTSPVSMSFGFANNSFICGKAFWGRRPCSDVPASTYHPRNYHNTYNVLRKSNPVCSLLLGNQQLKMYSYAWPPLDFCHFLLIS